MSDQDADLRDKFCEGVHLLYARRGQKPKHLSDYPEDERYDIVVETEMVIRIALPPVVQYLEGRKIAKVIFVSGSVINFIPE